MKLRFFFSLQLILFFSLSGCKAQDNEISSKNLIEPRFWDLSTGSHIAYINYPSNDSLKSVPLIFIHGGPGAYQVSEYIDGKGKEWFERLANSGFDIYLYDQVGSGLSARLTNPEKYTIDRLVADLEAIRQVTGGKKFILVGSSFGAALTANYIKSYPQHVLKAVFACPGYLDPSEWTDDRPSTPQMTPEFKNWIINKDNIAKSRYLKLDNLIRKDLQTAYKSFPDSEMDSLLDEFINSILSTAVYNPDLVKSNTHGMGWWAYTMICRDAVCMENHLRLKLAGLKIPVLILRGDADYVPEAAAHQYEDVFVNSKFVKIEKAGHLIWLDQPKVYTEQIELFLHE